MKKIIVNADDFGLCSGTVSGILAAWRKGIVTSASLLVTTPSCDLALKAALSHPKLDMGIHLSFTEGSPVLPAAEVPSLVDDSGRFPSARQWRETRRRPNSAQLAAEFAAQIERSRQAGVALTHLSLQSYVGYVLPDVFALACDLAARHGLAMRYPFSEGWEDTAPALLSACQISRLQSQAVASGLQSIMAASGVAHPDYYVEAFNEGQANAGDLMSAIAQARQGITEFSVHPAQAAGCKTYLGPAAANRAIELEFLCEKRMRRMLEIAQCELTTFRELVGKPAPDSQAAN